MKGSKRLSGIEMLNQNEMGLWDDFVYSHELGSIYHTSYWMEMIKKVYEHEPCYLILKDKDGNLSAGLPLCFVKSKIGRNRFVSVPCAQYCDPLVTSQEEFGQFISYLLDFIKNRDFRSIELRMTKPIQPHKSKYGRVLNEYHHHLLNLDQPLDMIKRSLHKSCIQRGISKAYKSGLELSVGESINDVKSFYKLYLQMRRRHGLLPQPFSFFSNMWGNMSKSKNITILLAKHKGRIISSVLLLKYRNTVIYEYGASNEDMMNVRPSHLLLWEAIKHSQLEGYKTFDFGRTSNENDSLSQFKSRWGAKRQPLFYYLVPDVNIHASMRKSNLINKMMNYSMKYLPSPLCQLMGQVVYKYVV
jgi:hypothetical protein